MFQVAIGSVMHESNTFSPIKTKLDDFKEDQLLLDDAVFVHHRGKPTEIGGMLAMLEKSGAKLVPTLSATAIPSGPVTKEAFDFLTENLLEQLQQVGHLDGVLLALHGGMGTDDIDDAEGFLLRRIREIAGVDALIGLTLDLHANVSVEMVEHADFIIGYRTHPHVDQKDIGVRAAELMIYFLKNKLKPVMKMKKLPMLLPGESSPVPREKLLRRVEEIEKKTGVLSASFFIGFPFADIREIGPCALVVTEGNEQLAVSGTDNLAQLIWDLRDEFTLPVVSLDRALERTARAGNGPVVLVDMGDCSYAGAAGDVPYFLRCFLDKGVKNAVIAAIIDSESVDKCIQSGTGAKITLEIGGKLDQVNGKPVSAAGTVKFISNGKYRGQDFYLTETKMDIGPTVVFDAGGIDMILVRQRMTTYDPALLRSLNIEPNDRKIIVLKGGLLNSVTYRSIAKEIIPFNSPGFACWDFTKKTYFKIPRPIFPLDSMEEI